MLPETQDFDSFFRQKIIQLSKREVKYFISQSTEAAWWKLGESLQRSAVDAGPNKR